MTRSWHIDQAHEAHPWARQLLFWVYAIAVGVIAGCIVAIR